MSDIPLLLPRHLPGDPIAAEQLAAAYRYSLDRDTVHQARVVWWALHHDRDIEPSTVDRLGAAFARFAARQRTLGRQRLDTTTTEDAAAFLWATTRRGHQPAIATVHLRRASLRLGFRMLDFLDGPVTDPTAAVRLPPKTRSRLRPVDSVELGLVRIAAAGRTRNHARAEATVALAEATATTGEIAAVRWADVHLGDSLVQLPGAGRVAARNGKLTDWGIGALKRHRQRERPEPHDLVAYRGDAAPGSQPSQAVIVNRLTKLMVGAGLDDTDLRPTSIRLWQAADALAAGARIEEAARLLGLASLDVTAAQLGYRWQS
jgi:integrase